MLRRTRQLGGSIDDLLLIYKIQIRCTTELSCPAWNGALTKVNIDKLEKLQKIAIKIILGEKYKSYKHALSVLKLETLYERRKKICISFANKTTKILKYKAWFIKNNVSSRTNTNKYKSKKYFEVFSRTSAYEKSPLIYLINLLNNQ